MTLSVIRPLIKSHLRRVGSLDKKFFPNSPPLPSDKIFGHGLYQNKVLQGYCVYSREKYPWLLSLRRFLVAPQLQGTGKGNLLLSASLEDYQSKCIMLHVRESNLKAIEIYLKHDFMIISKLENYYGKESSYLMLRRTK